jgi:hypothetical protein
LKCYNDLSYPVYQLLGRWIDCIYCISQNLLDDYYHTVILATAPTNECGRVGYPLR